MEQVLPEVLGHESEQSQECPAKGVVAGVAVVRVPPGFQTDVAIWTDPEHSSTISVVIHVIVEVLFACTYPASELFPHSRASN